MSETTDEPREDVVAKSPATTNTSNESQSLVKTNESQITAHIGGAINSLNLFNEKELIAAENFLTKIMRSEKGGIKTVNDGLAVLMRCQDLAIPFSTAIEHVHVINGKTGIDIHIAKTLLLRAACTWRCINDYQAQYEYTDGSSVFNENNLPEYAVKCKDKKEAEDLSAKDVDKDKIYVYMTKWYKDYSGNLYKDYMLNSQKYQIVNNKSQVQEVVKSGKIPVYRIAAQPVDYITKYEFTRYRNIFGKIVETKAIGKFSYSEAVTAEMFEKDTYKKYPRIMIAHRAFMYGARDIASDVLLGAYSITELKQFNNIEIIDSEYEEI